MREDTYKLLDKSAEVQGIMMNKRKLISSNGIWQKCSVRS